MYPSDEELHTTVDMLIALVTIKIPGLRKLLIFATSGNPSAALSDAIPAINGELALIHSECCVAC